MANKALSKRQKLMIRNEPARIQTKPRNPFAVAAKQRAAGAHRKNVSAERHILDRLLQRALEGDE
ncbi:hypothetical protein E4K72_12135 [Oxalobacteraceae bacterium OM1]|nr:hypothetical protein E4K72_12135 [Oxalobacteraceae bacterium OM1]